MCDCHNSDAEHEVAMANIDRLREFGKVTRENLANFINDVFSLPGVQEAVYDVEAQQLADAIEVLGERGEL